MMKKIFVLSAVLMVSACVGDRKPVTVYNIDPEPVVSESSCKTGATIQIGAPTASSGLEGRRIAVINESKLDYYNGIRWAASISEMTQQVLVENFEKSGAFKTVSTDVDGVDVQYVLLTDIRDYQVTDAKAPKVKLRYVSKLLRGNSVVATIPVEKEVAPAANKTEEIVATFSKLTAEAASDLVAETKKKISGCR